MVGTNEIVLSVTGSEGSSTSFTFTLTLSKTPIYSDFVVHSDFVQMQVVSHVLQVSCFDIMCPTVFSTLTNTYGLQLCHFSQTAVEHLLLMMQPTPSAVSLHQGPRLLPELTTRSMELTWAQVGSLLQCCMDCCMNHSFSHLASFPLEIPISSLITGTNRIVVNLEGSDGATGTVSFSVGLGTHFILP